MKHEARKNINVTTNYNAFPFREKKKEKKQQRGVYVL